MISFAQELERRMLDQLEEITRQAETDLQQAERSYLLIRGCLRELTDFGRDYVFKDRKEELTFYKEVKPKFVREWFFYCRLFSLEASMPVGSSEQQACWMKRQLEELNQYLTDNQFLYLYSRSGQTYMDEQLFVAEPADALVLMYARDSEPDGGNTFSYLLGKIQAAEDLAAYLLRRIALTSQGEPAAELDKQEVHWDGSLAQLYEIGYGLFTAGLVRGTVKSVIERLGYAFAVKPGNYYRYMLNMRIRKKSPTQCLDLMTSSLLEYMRQADLDPKYK
ncbi:RteC protein [Chitinophaga eiseniae]|uniref:RteC protein n=1 Tax=Chitinophaga eiseniae TaxID=634771 RepID=A0A1T4SYB8_9BACT|nr:RteC domain-containing protein [Chitinophaga eiseniae]SKA32901.1 RteC protein [Chitinophaga eiseniae]